MPRVPKCSVCGKPKRRGKCECNGKTLAQKIEDLKPKADFKGRQPTDEQQEAIDHVSAGFSILVEEAGAGTGKTSLLEMMGQVLKGNGQYTAFNSALVAESEAKFRGTRVACNTTHSLAFRARGKYYAHRLNGARVRGHDIARMLGIDEFAVEGVNESGDPVTRRLAPGFLATQVTMAIKKFCQSADPELTTSHFRYVDGIDFPKTDGSRTYSNNQKLREFLLPYAKKAWEDLSKPDGTLPFSHDHYVKIWQLDNPVISADYIMLDEAQDTAPVMLDILRQQVDRGTPVILVGDSAQQIYEWRGAVNAMAAFPGAKRLFLTQSFRFGEAIAQVANLVLAELHEQTPLRLRGLPSIPSRVEPIEEPTAILCRTNAAAIASLLGAIVDNKKATLVGNTSEIKAFLKAAIDLQKGVATNHPELGCFMNWSEVQEYSKQDEGEDLRLMVKLIDKFDARCILDAINCMPKESEADLVISTAHKSKGRQWKHVQLAPDFPTKDRCGDPELKLLYVAVTRAQLTLDISRCPYFTGEGGVDVTKIIENQPTQVVEEPPLIKEAPSDPPPTGSFTWSKIKDDGSWGIKGPSGKSGQTVEVTRKDGSTSKVLLAVAVLETEEFSVYRKG